MKLAILVLSAAAYEDRREAVRETWGSNLASNVDLVFLVGGGTGVPSRVGDILTLPCPDDYPSLPQKTRWGMLWATTTYGGLPINGSSSSSSDCTMRIFKCDDDTFVHIPRLLDFIDTNPPAYVGHEMTNEFPSFASGGAGYLLNRDAAITVAGGLTDPIGNEDLLVSRVLMAAKIPFTPCSRFHPWNANGPRADNDFITSHYQKPEMMRATWARFQEQRIPKTFHWIWLGNNEMPATFVEYRRGWLEKHPGWEYAIWTDANLPPLANQREFDAAKTMAQKADILRYEIMHRFGGVYLDTDFECLRNIEPLLWNVDGFAGAQSASTVAIGILGAVPGHPLFAEIIRRLPTSFAATTNIVNATGPGFFSRHCVGRKDFRIVPPVRFYPFNWDRVWCGPIEQAYAVHHWSHSWATPVE